MASVRNFMVVADPSVLAFSLSMYADGRTVSEKDDISTASTVMPIYPRFA